MNGIQWHYVDEEAPEGTVILFLHGLPEGWYSWHYVLPWVDHKYRLIAIDMKGYGRSDLQDGDYNWHHVAREIGGLRGNATSHAYYCSTSGWEDWVLVYGALGPDLVGFFSFVASAGAGP